MNRFGGLRFLPGLISGATFVWGGTRVAATSIRLAVLMLGIGATTIALALRMMVGDRAGKGFESTGELTTPHFDYLIWTALLVPMLLVVALVIIAVTSAMTSR